MTTVAFVALGGFIIFILIILGLVTLFKNMKFESNDDFEKRVAEEVETRLQNYRNKKKTKE